MMSHKTLGALRMADGLVFCDSWFLPGEGPFTVLAKLAIANVLNANRIYRVFGVRSTPTRDASPHGRSLLQLEWLARSRSAPLLAANLWSRSLLSQSQRWGQAVASDRALRYCPTCLSMGYQSSLCQIEGLVRCPQHNDLLLDHCKNCNAPTPPYALTAEAFDEPLVCTHCRKAYASIWASGGGDLFQKQVESESAYRRLGQWFGRAETLNMQWPDRVGWLADPRAPTQAVKTNKRIQVLGALTSLVTCSEPTAFRRSEVWVGSWPLSSSVPQVFAPSRTAQNEITRARVAIYKSIRRHHARRIGLRVQAHIKGDSERLIEINDGMVMPCNEHVSPAAHGFLAWRLRFESNAGGQGRDSGLSLFSVLLFWPVDWTASDAAWGHFAHRCLLLDLVTARELNKALKGLDYNRASDSAAWLEVVGLWYHRFGSLTRPWPDSLSFFRLPAGVDQPGAICIITAPSASLSRGASNEC